MFRIKELDRSNVNYVENIAFLHKKAFSTFFLTQLGVPFLKTLYSGYIEDVNSGIIVAEENNKLVGFIAYSKDYPQFYKKLINNHLLRFALCSFYAVVCHPLYIIRLIGAFKKSESVVKNEKYVELASICVDPDIEGKGVGSQLVNYLKSIVDYNIYAYINLETDANGNDSVNNFYEKNGFKLARQYYTSEGRKMNEYRFTLGDNL